MGLEEFAEILADLKWIRQMHESFQKKHGEVIAKFVSEDVEGEEYLYMETLLDIYCKMADIGHCMEVFITPIKDTGVLSKNEAGQICYNDVPLKPMDRLEVLLKNEEFGINGWTRALVGLNDEGQYLIGIPRDVDINGVKARIRG